MVQEMTTGQVIVMGRKTFESIGKPLPNRTTIVLTRSPEPIPGVRTISDLGQIDPADRLAGREVFICGGAQLYQQALPLCSDFYLTLVQRVVEGDAFFPPFEDQFELVEEVLDRPEFKILHYRTAVGIQVAVRGRAGDCRCAGLPSSEFRFGLQLSPRLRARCLRC